jgi:glycosyltransferase involved in cell wall biosynthesis
MNKLIKVLYVSHFDHLRMGGQKSMFSLIENLDRDKFLPLAICPRPGELSDRLSDIGCKSYFVDLCPIKPKNTIRFFSNIREIHRILKNDDIDIIHPDHERDAMACGLAKKRSNTKMVWHIRLTRKNNLDKINSSLADAIIGISEGTRHRVPPQQEQKFRKIFNGVDCEVFAPAGRTEVRQKLGLPPDRFIISFVGQLNPGKGIFDLLSAAKIINGRMDDEKLPLILFIGTEENQEVLSRFNKNIRSMGIDSLVRHIPQQSNIHEWMQASEIITLPSHEGVEGMGRVIFEAMATQAAAVGADISGLREAISPETGITVPEKSPDRLAQALMRLINNPGELRSKQDAARRRAQEHFDIKKHARNVERVYLDILR